MCLEGSATAAVPQQAQTGFGVSLIWVHSWGENLGKFCISASLSFLTSKMEVIIICSPHS